jgi:dihydropyrimidine dehydrogenase (NAD+) subunit PreA
MHYGFRIVDHLRSGLEGWMRSKGYRRLGEIVGRSVSRIKPWGELDLSYKVVAEIDQETCIHCGLCYVSCDEGCHQSIRRERVPVDRFVATRGSGNGLLHSGGRTALAGAGGDVVNVYTINEETCVGCNMCSLVCPVEGCISMIEVETGKPPMSWNDYQELLAQGKVDKIEPPEHV